MVANKVYIPEPPKPGDGFPVVIGLPGFVSPLGKGRTEENLELLSREGIAGISVKYTQIEQRQGTEGITEIVCNFNLNQYIAEVTSAFKIIGEDPRLDGSRVGILASSIGAAIFTHFLAEHSEHQGQVRAYVSVSPMLGWDYYGGIDTRNALEAAITSGQMTEISIGNQTYDKDNKINRYIPASDLNELKRVDALRVLDEIELNSAMRVLTIVGREDTVASNASIIAYHRKISGKNPESYLMEFNCGHEVPNATSQRQIVDFFTDALAA